MSPPGRPRRPPEEEWAERLSALVGSTARRSRAYLAPDPWTGGDAVAVRVEAVFQVASIAGEGGCLVVSGRDGDGRSHEVRVPAGEAFLGFDERAAFFLAGWREPGGDYVYLRISQDDARDPVPRPPSLP
ncbi:MAG: hypothetical protein IRZ11_02835 [Clostridia bacterium]|nr:hypothetical protein [Clostridia bacterium]